MEMRDRKAYNHLLQSLSVAVQRQCSSHTWYLPRHQSTALTYYFFFSIIYLIILYEQFFVLFFIWKLLTHYCINKFVNAKDIFYYNKASILLMLVL